MKKAELLITAAVVCGLGRTVLADAPNAFVQTNLVSNSAAYNPTYPTLDPHMLDAWGIANRGPTAGGHIWIDNAFDGTSDEYIGDVNGTPLYQDGLKSVTLDTPQFTDHGYAFVTGLVYNGGSDLASQATEFPISGASYNANSGAPIAGGYTGPAKFIFVTEDGEINAWGTNTANAMDSAPVILDYSKSSGSFSSLGDAANPVFSGVAMTTNPVTAPQVGTAAGNHIYAADFRNNNINVFNDQWQNVTSSYTFQTPSDLTRIDPTTDKPEPLHIFNIQELGGHLYATYAGFNSQGDEGQEEIDENGLGAVVEYNNDGSLVKEFTDSTNPADELDAPWGVAIAPAGWGPFGGDLLVTNFGDNGTISVFNNTTGDYIGKLDDTSGNPISIDGIWGLTFGNGLSNGDTNSLYFTAGPNSEFDGVFGKITVAPVPEPTSLGLLSIGATALLGRRRRKA